MCDGITVIPSGNPSPKMLPSQRPATLMALCYFQMTIWIAYIQAYFTLSNQITAARIDRGNCCNTRSQARCDGIT